MAHGFEYTSETSVPFLFSLTPQVPLFPSPIEQLCGHSEHFTLLFSHPGAAAAVCSLVVLYRTDPLDRVYAQLIEFLPFYAGVLGLLMVSAIRYVHVSKWLGTRHRYKLKIFMVIAFFMAFSWHPAVVGTVAINLYVLSGPLHELWLRLRPAKPAAPPAPGA
jgi:phosphatidylserine synthase